VIRDIAGRQNHSVKLARKLQKKKHRRERGLLVCEGMDLLVAAVASGANVQDVLVRRDLVATLPLELVEQAKAPVEQSEGRSVDVGVCDQETLDYAGSLGGATDVVFTCAQPQWGLGDIPMLGRLTLFLDGVGDPGNVGTIVRSAVAFGVAGVACSPGTADPYGPKAMRAGMGAQFEIPVVPEVPAADLMARLSVLAEREAVVPHVWVADPHEGEDVRDINAENGVVLVLGAERTGVSGEWQSARRVTIPQPSRSTWPWPAR